MSTATSNHAPKHRRQPSVAPLRRYRARRRVIIPVELGHRGEVHLEVGAQRVGEFTVRAMIEAGHGKELGRGDD
jgi:hypothetical protein